MKKGASEASLLMWDQLHELSGRLIAVKEFPFARPRKWRFDFAVFYGEPEQKLAIEIDGGMWIQGRHTRGSGQMKDNEKFNHAALLGWKILKFDPSQVLDGTAIDFIERVLDT